MPGAPEHPVTVGDLFFNRSNLIVNGKPVPGPYRPATVADLVLALRAEEQILKQLKALYWEWFPNATELSARRHAEKILDALAEAQPFPLAGNL